MATAAKEETLAGRRELGEEEAMVQAQEREAREAPDPEQAKVARGARVATVEALAVRAGPVDETMDLGGTVETAVELLPVPEQAAWGARAVVVRDQVVGDKAVKGDRVARKAEREASAGTEAQVARVQVVRGEWAATVASEMVKAE